MIEIKVGDYVETNKGEICYIVSLDRNSSFTWKPTNSEYNRYSGNQQFLKVNFKRIGISDFTAKKNKIKPLEEIVESENVMDSITRRVLTTFELKRLPNNKELMDKINEIIEYINKEEK